MKRKINVVFKLLIIFFMLLVVLNGNLTYARHEEGAGGAGSDKGGKTTTGINVEVDQAMGTEDTPYAVKTAVGRILGIIRAIGAVVMVGTIVTLGVKYMLSSAEGKADYKKAAIPYLVGAIILFAGSNIVGIIYDVATGM